MRRQQAVHQHVQTAESFQCQFSDTPRTGGIGEVGLHRKCAAAGIAHQSCRLMQHFFATRRQHDIHAAARGKHRRGTAHAWARP
jgi:hypothetical protein